MSKSEAKLNTSVGVVVAKILRNSEVPEPYKTRIIRDLCVLFTTQFKSFNQKQFVYVAHGGIIPPGLSAYWKHFDTFKYLDEQYANKPEDV